MLNEIGMLGDRLARELPGICHWAMQGLGEWMQQGLKPPPRVLQSTGNYREENDTVGQWIEAACVQGPGLLTSMKGLYESYKSFCENSSIEALHNTCFGKELERRGFEKIKGRLGNQPTWNWSQAKHRRFEGRVGGRTCAIYWSAGTGRSNGLLGSMVARRASA